jgi:uncharacterized protein with FMN-binding domain
MMKIWQKIMIVGGCCLVLLSCAKTVSDTPLLGGPVIAEQLVDGVYEGRYKGGLNSAVVKVTIQGQKIAAIEIVKHSAWKGKKAEPIIPQRIIDQQSTMVDAVTGATNSSKVIMNAVQVAVEQAYHAPQK